MNGRLLAAVGASSPLTGGVAACGGGDDNNSATASSGSASGGAIGGAGATFPQPRPDSAGGSPDTRQATSPSLPPRRFLGAAG